MLKFKMFGKPCQKECYCPVTCDMTFTVNIKTVFTVCLCDVFELLTM